MERELASAEPFSCLIHAGTHHGTGGGRRIGREKDAKTEQVSWTETEKERAAAERKRRRAGDGKG